MPVAISCHVLNPPEAIHQVSQHAVISRKKAVMASHLISSGLHVCWGLPSTMNMSVLPSHQAAGALPIPQTHATWRCSLQAQPLMPCAHAGPSSTCGRSSLHTHDLSGRSGRIAHAQRAAASGGHFQPNRSAEAEAPQVVLNNNLAGTQSWQQQMNVSLQESGEHLQLCTSCMTVQWCMQ